MQKKPGLLSKTIYHCNMVTWQATLEEETKQTKKNTETNKNVIIQ